MGIRVAALLLSAALLGAPADFAGAWRLSPAKSDFGRVTGLQSQQIAVRQQGDVLTVKTSLVDGRGTSESTYTLDASGKPVENVIRGVKVESIASWRGSLLHVKSKATLRNTEIQSVDQWQLGEGGKELIIYRSAATPQGDVEQRYVYEKVSSSP